MSGGVPDLELYVITPKRYRLGSKLDPDSGVMLLPHGAVCVAHENTRFSDCCIPDDDIL